MKNLLNDKRKLNLNKYYVGLIILFVASTFISCGSSNAGGKDKEPRDIGLIKTVDDFWLINENNGGTCEIEGKVAEKVLNSGNFILILNIESNEDSCTIEVRCNELTVDIENDDYVKIKGIIKKKGTTMFLFPIKVTKNESIEEKKYKYILESDKSYQELISEGSNIVYLFDLLDDKVIVEEKYKERVELLKKQRDEEMQAKNQEKKASLDVLYPHIKIAGNEFDAAKEVESNLRAELNRTYRSSQYDLTVLPSSSTIKFKENVGNDITRGELTAITRKIYDMYQDAGLLRNETELNRIYIYFEIEGQRFTSSWELGESPKDDWNED